MSDSEFSESQFSEEFQKSFEEFLAQQQEEVIVKTPEPRVRWIKRDGEGDTVYQPRRSVRNLSKRAGQSCGPDPACLAPDTNCGEIVAPDTNCGEIVAPDTNCGEIVAPDTNCGEIVAPDTNCGEIVAPDTNCGEIVAPDTNCGEIVAPDTNCGEIVAPDTNCGEIVAPDTNCGESVAPETVGFSDQTKMTRPKFRPCPVCKEPNQATRKTCSKCYSVFSLKRKWKEREAKYMKGEWGKAVLKHNNASRIVDQARIIVGKLEVLGRKPILFIGQNKPTKKAPVNWVTEVVTYLAVEDHQMTSVLDAMTRAYEYILKLKNAAAAAALVGAAPPALLVGAISPSTLSVTQWHPVPHASALPPTSKDPPPNSMDVCPTSADPKPITKASATVTPFTSAKKDNLTKKKMEELHMAVVKFVVKELLSFSTVESPWFREMTTALNPDYRPPSKDDLSNTLIPAWYSAEKHKVVQELAQVKKAAITCDGWTSVAQDHYVTLTVHYISQGHLKQKVLDTKAVYESKTGLLVAEEMQSVLEEFQINTKVVAATVDNASNVDVALKNLKFLKLGCFAHTLNLAAMKVNGVVAVAKWCARVRAVVLWLKRSAVAKTVLAEKQRAFKLPEDDLILDVRTRWDSLYLMMQRFLEQYRAIQAASLDRRLRKPMEEARLERLTDDDRHKAEEFLRVMKLLYTLTGCVSSEQSPTCGQILPILNKLHVHFTVAEDDTPFTRAVKEKVWADLRQHYQDEDVLNFLQEATLMDPRFKRKLCEVDADDAWDRLENVAVTEQRPKDPVDLMPTLQMECSEESDDSEEDKKEEYPSSHNKRVKKSALEELFEDEDEELLKATTTKISELSVAERVRKEMEIYKGLPPIPSGQDPVAWWWLKRDSLPMLSALSNTYLCVQASSTPSERVFSRTGHEVSQERCGILPENANMVIFLQKNC